MEVEKLELENKKLEEQLARAEEDVQAMEKNNEKMRTDLEDQIKSTEAQVLYRTVPCPHTHPTSWYGPPPSPPFHNVRRWRRAGSSARRARRYSKPCRTAP